MRRKLLLKKETLAELSAVDLRIVRGGASGGNTLCLECINDFSFEKCPIPSLPLEECPLTQITVIETIG